MMAIDKCFIFKSVIINPPLDGNDQFCSNVSYFLILNREIFNLR